MSAAIATGHSLEDAIWAEHLPHHLGIDRTFYLVRQIRGDVSREQVKQELATVKHASRLILLYEVRTLWLRETCR